MLMFAMLMVLGWWVLQVNLNVMRVVSVQWSLLLLKRLAGFHLFECDARGFSSMVVSVQIAFDSIHALVDVRMISLGAKSSV
jgi:hypothetical protein